ncbi:MAG: extracellular solute-binding protein [Chloroflexota bacterium]|nr:extracellular solute-binding protein [Chloroflexota bacterium]
MSPTTRRQFLRRAAGVGAVTAVWPLLAACGGGGAAPSQASSGSAPRTLRIMMNGGLSQQVITKAVFDPFSKANNVKVEVTPSNSEPMLTKLRAEKAAPTVDAVIWDDLVAVQGRDEGLIEKIDASNVPNLKALSPQADYHDGYGPAVQSNPIIYAFNTSLFHVQPPATFKELWDARFKKSLYLSGIDVTPGVLFLVRAAQANGGSYENIDPGFAALKKLLPNVGGFYHSVADITNGMKTQPYLVQTGTGLPQAAIKDGTPIQTVFLTDGSDALPAVFDIVKGTKQKALLEQLLNFYIDVPQQTGIAKGMYWTMFNPKVQLPADYKDKVPTKINVYDPRKIAKNREAWAARWKTEIGG